MNCIFKAITSSERSENGKHKQDNDTYKMRQVWYNKKTYTYMCTCTGTSNRYHPTSHQSHSIDLLKGLYTKRSVTRYMYIHVHNTCTCLSGNTITILILVYVGFVCTLTQPFYDICTCMYSEGRLFLPPKVITSHQSHSSND